MGYMLPEINLIWFDCIFHTRMFVGRYLSPPVYRSFFTVKLCRRYRGTTMNIPHPRN